MPVSARPRRCLFDYIALWQEDTNLPKKCLAVQSHGSPIHDEQLGYLAGCWGFDLILPAWNVYGRRGIFGDLLKVGAGFMEHHRTPENELIDIGGYMAKRTCSNHEGYYHPSLYRNHFVPITTKKYEEASAVIEQMVLSKLVLVSPARNIDEHRRRKFIEIKDVSIKYLGTRDSEEYLKAIMAEIDCVALGDIKPKDEERIAKLLRTGLSIKKLEGYMTPGNENVAFYADLMSRHNLDFNTPEPMRPANEIHVRA